MQLYHGDDIRRGYIGVRLSVLSELLSRIHKSSLKLFLLLVGEIEVLREALEFGHDLLTFFRSDWHVCISFSPWIGLNTDARCTEMSGSFPKFRGLVVAFRSRESPELPAKEGCGCLAQRRSDETYRCSKARYVATLPEGETSFSVGGRATVTFDREGSVPRMRFRAGHCYQ